MKPLHYVLSGVSKISIVGADFSTPFPKTQRCGFVRCISSGSRPVSRNGAVIEAIKYRRLSRYKIRKIILYFTGDITASFVSKILHINRKTINAYYNEIREKILHHSLREREKELGEFELDENCFGARRVCEKRGQGTADNQWLQSLRGFRHGTNLCAENHTSTALNAFRVTPNVALQSSMVDYLRLKESEFKSNHKNDNFASFTERMFFRLV